MFKLRTHDRDGKEIYAPENPPIINIQCKDPLIDLLEHWINPEDGYEGKSVADLLRTLQFDIESDNGRKFLKEDLKRLFEAVGMEN